jgi:RNA-binding protein
MGHDIPVILQLGKAGISANVVAQANDALEAHELIKVRVLDAAPLTPEEAVSRLAELTGAEPVHTLGNTLLLYRRAEEDPELELPEA